MALGLIQYVVFDRHFFGHNTARTFRSVAIQFAFRLTVVAASWAVVG